MEGPAVPPFREINGSAGFGRIPTWAGSVAAPAALDEAKQAMKTRLVESLAPFLIIASPTTFFGYGWWYNIESGYTPCDGAGERSKCLAPDGWFPEFSRHLGPPEADATQAGAVWTREFEGASVYVDLSNRSKCRIQWR